MNILVIDAQGGGIGKQVITAIKKEYPKQSVIAVGTNSAATAAMLKAGADNAATGENSVVVCSAKADVIIGPMGIVVADSMLGEITPKMAVAVGQSSAQRILIPINHCDNFVVGVMEIPMSQMIERVMVELRKVLA